MEADLIGLFALLVGLELILGVDNVLVIAILVARLPEARRELARNLGLALALGGCDGIHAVAADTDGIDGTEDNAGAYVLPDTLARAEAAGLDPTTLLANNDAYNLFAGIGSLLISGPTLTNVNDFRAILIDPV